MWYRGVKVEYKNCFVFCFFFFFVFEVSSCKTVHMKLKLSVQKMQTCAGQFAVWTLIENTANWQFTLKHIMMINDDADRKTVTGHQDSPKLIRICILLTFGAFSKSIICKVCIENCISCWYFNFLLALLLHFPFPHNNRVWIEEVQAVHLATSQTLHVLWNLICTADALFISSSNRNWKWTILRLDCVKVSCSNHFIHIWFFFLWSSGLLSLQNRLFEHGFQIEINDNTSSSVCVWTNQI